MLYGRVKDFYVAASEAERSIVKFLVNFDDYERNDSSTVCAEIPNDALVYNMIKAGAIIGWQRMMVFLEIEGVRDVPFKKVGLSNGDEVTFYEHLKILSDLKKDI